MSILDIRGRKPYFERKRRDTGNPLVVNLIDENTGDYLDLATGVAEVRFYMTLQNHLALVHPDASESLSELDFTQEGNIEGTATVSNGSEGEVTYNWGDDDLDVSGLYYAEFEIEYDSGDKRTWPAGRYIFIKVGKDIGQK